MTDVYTHALTGSANEPRRAVIFTWAVAQGCLFLGDLDDVAPIITSFFCLSYGRLKHTAVRYTLIIIQ